MAYSGSTAFFFLDIELLEGEMVRFLDIWTLFTLSPSRSEREFLTLSLTVKCCITMKLVFFPIHKFVSCNKKLRQDKYMSGDKVFVNPPHFLLNRDIYFLQESIFSPTPSMEIIFNPVFFLLLRELGGGAPQKKRMFLRDAFFIINFPQSSNINISK